MQMRQLNSPMLADDAEDPLDSEPTRQSVKQRDKEGWFAYLKKHGPTVLSILSVLLNVIILSAVVPALKSDISFVQGQAASLQSSVNSFNGVLSDILLKAKDAQSSIAEFNAEFVSTQQLVNATVRAAEATQNETTVVLAAVGVAQTQVQLLLHSIANSTQQMIDVRTDFIEHVAPQLARDMQRLNASKQSLSYFCGYSAVTTGSAGGLSGANLLCGAACGGSSTAHVCSSSELLSTASQNSAVPILGHYPGNQYSSAWVNTGVYGLGTYSATVKADTSSPPIVTVDLTITGTNDCNGWTLDTTVTYGSQIELPPAPMSAGNANCNDHSPFVCCDYRA